MNNRFPYATQPITSRLIKVPHGPTQLVSLQAGWWDCLDWLIEFKGETLDEISSFCFKYAKNHPADDFASAFNHYLHWGMMNHLAGRHHLANENYWSVKPDWDIPRHKYREKLAGKFSFCFRKNPMEDLTSAFEKHLPRYVMNPNLKRPKPANENFTDRNDVWDKLPHRNYRIAMTKKFSFLPG